MFKGIKGIATDSLSSWNVSNIKSMNGMLEGVTLPIDVYDDLLIEWSKLSLQKNVKFSAGNSIYSSASASSRDALTTTLDWRISDGGGENLVADAGENIIKEKGSTITLDGSKSYSRESNITAYEWKYQDNILSRDMNFTLGTPLDVGTHIVTLTVTDSNGLKAEDTMKIEIVPNANVDKDAFITTWKTDLINKVNPTNDSEIKIPCTGSCDYNIYWGDGTKNEHVNGGIKHLYKSAGTYTVKITGDFNIHMVDDLNYDAGDADIYYGVKYQYKLLSIEQWGDIKWTSMKGAFAHCKNLKINASDKPNLSNVRDMSYMFYGAFNIHKEAIKDWDLSSVAIAKHVFSWGDKDDPILNNSNDYANNANDATVIELNSSQTGIFDYEEDFDFFKINIVESGRLNLNIIRGQDFVLCEFLDRDEHQLNSSIDDTSVNVSPGVYYLKLLAEGSAYDEVDDLNYEFTVTLTPDSN